MGFFDKLFEKKVCSICGNDIGLFGNRKLEDGNMCSDCADKLSPWFKERRESTATEIREQLTYREENLRQLERFNVTRVIGDNYKMYIEEVDGVPTRFYVSKQSKPLEENPDIIAFRDIVTCVTDVSSHSSEIKEKNSSNEWVSRTPREFKYSYTFSIVMSLRNSPYFDQIKFDIGSCTVFLKESDSSGMRYANHSSEPTADRFYRKHKIACQEIEQLVTASRNAHSQTTAPALQPSARPNFCPNCGSPAGDGNFCANCGHKLT